MNTTYMAQVTLLLASALLTSNVLANSVDRLMGAVQRGETKLVAQITEQVAINSRDPKARTAVHYAVIHKQPEVLEFLIESGADLNLIDADGNTPYDLYTQDQHDEIGQILRNAAALTATDITKNLDKDDAKSTAGAAKAKRHTEMLFIAAEAGDREAIELLLEAGANPKAKNAAGEFPFHIAERNRHFVCCAILLKAIGGIDRGDNKSWTPLLWVILAREWGMAREFIREGAKFRYRNPTGQWPRQDAYDVAELTKQEDTLVAMAIAEQEQNQDILHGLMEKATREGKLNIYQKLLEHGLDLQNTAVAEVAVNQAFSYTSVHTGAVIDFLLANNINKHALAQKMTSHGALTDPSGSMKKILDYGIELNTLDISGITPLASALNKSSVAPETIGLLLKHGADPNVRTKEGSTALITLAKRITAHYNRYSKLNGDEYLKSLQILLEHRANPNIVHQNNTALDILQKELQARVKAYEYNKSDLTSSNIATIRSMIELLIAKGAKVAEEVGEGASHK